VLPDGIFSNRKSKYELILNGLAMEDVDILGPFCLFDGQMVYVFYVHLVHFLVIWHIFPRFGMLYREKSGNPGMYSENESSNQEWCIMVFTVAGPVMFLKVQVIMECFYPTVFSQVEKCVCKTIVQKDS
jgi:hypothetical protein